MAKQKRILYATTNPSKVVRMEEILIPFSLEILNLIDSGQTAQIQEDGRTPEANAIKKHVIILSASEYQHSRLMLV